MQFKLNTIIKCRLVINCEVSMKLAHKKRAKAIEKIFIAFWRAMNVVKEREREKEICFRLTVAYKTMASAS